MVASRFTVVFLGHLADRDQAVRGDFAAGHSGDDRVGPVFLNVAEVVIIAVLQAGQFAFEDKIIPAGGKNRCLA